MSEEQQQVSDKKYPAPVSAKFAGGTLITALPVLAHFGPTGLLLRGIASLVAYRHGPEIYDMARDTLPFLPSLEGRKAGSEQAGTPQGRSFWDRALGRYPDQDEPAQEDGEQEPANEADFVRVDQQSTDVPGVPRYGVDQIVRHIKPNCYKIYIGRSLTQPLNPALLIRFYKQHIKIIGASRKGKSSMAAALLEIVLRTHDTAHVLIALLDKEDRTGKLFANDPHIVQVRFNDGQEVSLHARSEQQVLEHLLLLVEILKYRYRLRLTDLAQHPLILIYLEEFLALKDFFKQRISKTRGAAKEQAIEDYDQLVYCIKEIARMGLKVKMQFLMCAQVDYRDDDLYEALANVTAGMCFCVKATAATAAGFLQTEMLNRNAKENRKGQCVVETPDCRDLILAPEYDLGKKLLALEERENIHHSPTRPSHELRDASVNPVKVNPVNPVNEPVKRVNDTVNAGEYSPESVNDSPEEENDSPGYTPSEEVQVLLAWGELQRAGKPITRSGIRDHLGWNSKHFSRIVKPVCDKHHIAEREG